MVDTAAAAPVASEASWRRRWFRVCSPREANRRHSSPRSRPRQTTMADPKVRATAQHRAVVASLAPSWAPHRDCLVESRMVLRRGRVSATLTRDRAAVTAVKRLLPHTSLRRRARTRPRKPRRRPAARRLIRAIRRRRLTRPPAPSPTRRTFPAKPSTSPMDRARPILLTASPARASRSRLMERLPASKRATDRVILLLRPVSRSMAASRRMPLLRPTGISSHMAPPTKVSPLTAHQTHSPRMAHRARNPATAHLLASSRLTDNSMASRMASRRMVPGHPRRIPLGSTERHLLRGDSSQATPASRHIRAGSHHTRAVTAADTETACPKMLKGDV